MAARINAEQFEELVLKAEKLVLVDFYSDTCIPCKMVSATLGDIADEYEDKIVVYKVNVNFEADLAAQYQVMAAPTIVSFYQGKETGRTRGAVGKDEITALFADHI